MRFDTTQKRMRGVRSGELVMPVLMRRVPLIAIRRAMVYLLLVAGVPACVTMVSAPPAQAEGSQWALCDSLGAANEDVLEDVLAPSNNATVQTGTSVTFSGISAAPLTFAVASSPALLSTPDIDSGPGVQQPGSSSGLQSYSFTSTKVTTTPRILYWTASFSRADLPECMDQSEAIFTTPLRTLIVVPAPVLPAPPVAQPAPLLSAPVVSLTSAQVAVTDNGAALVGLKCAGGGSCVGKLTLQVTVKRKHGGGGSRVTMGTAGFSIAAGKTGSVTVHLNGGARALLKADHGRLTASAGLELASGKKQARTVHLLEKSSRSRGGGS